MENVTQALRRMQQQQQPLASPSQTRSEQQGISIWANEPPASSDYISQWSATMSAAFPQMRPEFWVVVCKMIRKDGMSQKRLAYISETLCREWHYPTMTIADIFSIDRTLKIYGYEEFRSAFKTDYVPGYCIIKQRGRDGKIQFCQTEAAKLAGIAIEREL